MAEHIHEHNLANLSDQSVISSDHSLTIGARQVGNAATLGTPTVTTGKSNFYIIQTASIIKDDPREKLKKPETELNEEEIVSSKCYPNEHTKNPLFKLIAKTYPTDNKDRWQMRLI